MDLHRIDVELSKRFVSTRGCSAFLPLRVAGLLLLQNANTASDEAVVATWLENPYGQYVCAKTCLQTELPIDAPSLTHWRKRIGVEGV
jgi:IS5 family transposase